MKYKLDDASWDDGEENVQRKCSVGSPIVSADRKVKLEDVKSSFSEKERRLEETRDASEESKLDDVSNHSEHLKSLYFEKNLQHEDVLLKMATSNTVKDARLLSTSVDYKAAMNNAPSDDCWKAPEHILMTRRFVRAKTSILRANQDADKWESPNLKKDRQYEATLSKLSTTNSEKDVEIDRLRATLAKIDEEVARLVATLASKEVENARLKANNADLKDAYEIWKDAYARKCKEDERLEATIFKNSLGIARLGATNADLERANAKKDADIARLEPTVAALEDANKDLKDANEDLKDANAKKDADIARLEAFVADLKDANEEWKDANAKKYADNARLEASNANLEFVNAKKDAENAQLDATNADLKDAIEDLKEANAKKDAEIARLGATIADLEDANAKKDEDIACLKATVADFKDANANSIVANRPQIADREHTDQEHSAQFRLDTYLDGILEGVKFVKDKNMMRGN